MKPIRYLFQFIQSKFNDFIASSTILGSCRILTENTKKAITIYVFFQEILPLHSEKFKLNLRKQTKYAFLDENNIFFGGKNTLNTIQ